jgi:hypothetical protein
MKRHLLLTTEKPSYITKETRNVAVKWLEPYTGSIEGFMVANGSQTE